MKSSLSERNFFVTRTAYPMLFLLVLLLLPAVVVAQANHKVRPVDQLDIPETSEGRVTVDVLKGYGIGVALDLAPADGVVDRLYILQKAALAPDELPLYYDDARLLYHQHAVIVTGSPREQGVVLLLDRQEHLSRQMELVDGELHQVFGKRGAVTGSEELPTPHVYTGFGLIERPGTWLDPFEDLAREPGVVEKSGSCSPGATQCSVGCGNSCSITCSSGYYACCTCALGTENCECISEGGSGGGGLGGGGFGGGGDDECQTNGYCPAACMACSPYYGTEEETPDTAGS